MKNWKPIWLTRIAVLAVGLSFVAACEDDPLSPDAVDPEQTAQLMDDVVNDFFEGNDAVQNLEVFGDAITAALGGGFPTAGLFGAFDTSGPFAGVYRVQAAVAGLDEQPARLPVAVLGTTFVWDTQLSEYVPDLQRTDAPDNGVRFVLYAVNPILQLPIDPLEEIGFIDIIDTSSLPTIAIAMHAVVGTDTLISNTVSGTFGETSASITAAGFLSDGVDRLNFTMSITATGTDAVISFGISHGGFTIGFTLTGDLDAEAGTIVVTFADSDGNTIILTLIDDGLGNFGTGSGVTFNGSDVAIISGSFDNPTITNAEGDPLTLAELEALAGLLEATFDVFEFFMGMFEFTFILILLGVI